jgi:hypothetical protein
MISNPRPSWPTRVSRLYPVFALCFALSTAVLAYAWLDTQLNLESLSQQYDSRDATLRAQVASLSKSQVDATAELAVQKAQIDETGGKLADLQQQLATANSQLSGKESALSNAQNQLSSNASELQELRSRPALFDFANDSSQPDVSVQEAAVKQLVTNAYPYIEAVYGEPYLLDQVTITFVNQYQIAGSAGEILISNGPKGISIDIHLKEFNPDDFQDTNTVIHEMIHAFHGIAVIQTSALEEGETVAATDAVMAKMTAAGKIPNFGHLYLTMTPAQYAQENATLQIPADNATFYARPDISEIYQVIGEAWQNLYTQDPTIFSQVNAEYYKHVQNGQAATSTLVLQAIKDNVPTVAGEPINQYLSQNVAFNPS